METMKIDCPVCGGEKTASSITRTDKIPYFGEVMESMILCTKCGYKHNDIICLEQHDPASYTITINQEHLNTRIIKAQSATLTIPELGLKVEPGPKSQGYISNIEGVLNRFTEAVQRSKILFPNKKTQQNADKILENIDKVKAGTMTATLKLEDPFGQSKILHHHAKEHKLTPQETKKLKTGFTTIESE